MKNIENFSFKDFVQTIVKCHNEINPLKIIQMLQMIFTCVPVIGDQLGTDWLDTNMDLMKLLEQPQVEVTSADFPVVDASLSQAPHLSPEPMVSQSSVAVLLENFGQEQQVSAFASPVPSPTPSPAPPVVMDKVGEIAAQVDMLEVLSKLTEVMDGNLDILEQPSIQLPEEPILSPMSAEEVESILSSGPTSPGSSSLLEDSGFVDDSAAETVDLSPLVERKAPGPQRRATSKSRNATAPYSKPANSKEAKALDRKLRKKQQNKDAALRYRMKKKEEGNMVQSECEVLEARNKELRDKVDSMTREINYLKSLMAEVYKAKGLVKNSQEKVI